MPENEGDIPRLFAVRHHAKMECGLYQYRRKEERATGKIRSEEEEKKYSVFGILITQKKTEAVVHLWYAHASIIAIKNYIRN